MVRRFAILLSLLALALAPIQADSDTPDDSQSTEAMLEDGGDRLYNENQFDAAESLYREALKRNPKSATALMFHVKALDALGRYNEALDESLQALKLEPSNALTYDWFGITLVLDHQYFPAITALQTAIHFKPDDQAAQIWLAASYLQHGDQAKADLILDTEATAGDTKNQANTAMIIADVFRQMRVGDQAIAWWKKSYHLGNTDAAAYLAAAYSGQPGFPYDPGESDYWLRREPDPPHPWFPRLAFADQVVAWGHGWSLVFIALATVIILPWISVGIVAFFPARHLINEPTFPWMERARRAYPFMILLALATMVLPMLDWLAIFEYPGSLLPLPKWIVCGIVTFAGWWAVNAVAAYWMRLYRTDAGTGWENMKDTGITLLIRVLNFILFIVMGLCLPYQFGWRAALIIAGTIALYFYIQYGGWIQVARLCRLISPADPATVQDAAELARARGLPEPTVWRIPWRKANAFAFPFSNAIVVTDKMRDMLSRAEIKSILAHELAHLCEDRATRLTRLIVPLLLLPIFTANLWTWTIYDVLPLLIGSYLVFIGGLYILRKAGRRMEERADTFGKEAESEAGDYPLALAKLYEVNLVPAVMPGQRQTHPHLYDRLIAAGLTPDYPRPKPPARWGTWAGILILAIHGAGLMAIWLCLF